MKPILNAVVILAACGAAFFSFSLSNKFQALEKDRIETIAKNKETIANAEADEKKIEGLKGNLAAAQGKQETLSQSVSFLKSAGNALGNDLSKLTDDLKVQEDEFAQLQKTLDEVNEILKDLGGGVTLDTLPEKIQQIEEDKKTKQAKL